MRANARGWRSQPFWDNGLGEFYKEKYMMRAVGEHYQKGYKEFIRE